MINFEHIYIFLKSLSNFVLLIVYNNMVDKNNLENDNQKDHDQVSGDSLATIISNKSGSLSLGDTSAVPDSSDSVLGHYSPSYSSSSGIVGQPVLVPGTVSKFPMLGISWLTNSRGSPFFWAHHII